MVNTRASSRTVALEPVWQDQFKAEGATALVGPLLPLIDPGEAMHAPFGRLTDRGRNCRRTAAGRERT